ncbi:hypothetical protein C8Q77DRAFT_1215727 [Trametes polyzona]|nr:hypothetical protein C8Q77DRAFT_1215727 [Trametes polyzona]
MGIIFSLIFPGQFMSSQYSPTTTTTDDSRSSSPEHQSHPIPLLHPPDEDIPDPSPPSSPKHSVVASPPLDTQPYTPHALGIGILSPQPVLGRFAPISRASLSPLQVRTSPVEQRANPLECLSPRDRGSSNPFDLHALHTIGARSPDGAQASPPPPPSLRYVGDASSKDGPAGEHLSSANFSSASGSSSAGLRIALPPPNPSASTSTPSPPLLPPPANDPVANTVALNSEQSATGSVSDPQAPPVDLLAPPTDLNIDFTELDTEGYSALEKIYLFSRSRAGFHRVFIAHALPRYLLGAENATSDLPSQEQIEQITPSEAVDYVLPLLNILATDDDEAVKEALAAELVPIIWWFVTHCRLVEDDTTPQPPSPSAAISPASGDLSSSEHESSLPRPPTPQPDQLLNEQESALRSEISSLYTDQSEDTPTAIPVQAFTPLLGTLLLSPNGMVGGSARYAVVELLRRLRRADQREDDERASVSSSSDDMSVDGQSSQRISSPTPSQAAEEQDAEEHADVGLFQRNERRLFEHELVYQVVIGMGRLDMDDGRADQQEEFFDQTPGSGVSTAVPTPQAEVTTASTDSYFPATSLLGLAAGSDMTTPMPPSPPPQTTESASNTNAAPSPVPSPSPPASSGSSISDSPGNSCSSTPSLTSLTSSSSGGYSDNVEYDAPDQLSFGLGEMPKEEEEPSVPMAVDEVAGAELRMPVPEEWMPTNPLARHAALPTTPPFEVPPPPSPPPVAAPVPVSVEALPVTGLPLLQVQAPSNSPVTETAPRMSGGWLSPSSAAKSLAAAEEVQDDGSDVNEEAAVGRLSSMSLMAAVTASGSIGEEAKAAFVAEVERVGRDPIYWVRREASFAVGALAKVVPVEVVTSSLLPLFESLCHDPTWHVRHSVLFALPAILSRLAPDHRRRLALEVILPLSQDEEPTVRSAVLEALGEVMHTFVDDQDGPPEQLLKLFLGIRETEDPGGGEEGSTAAQGRALSPETRLQQPPSTTSTSVTSSAWSDYGTDAGAGPDIYDDPQRPLVCAFNYPAVALTLGRNRWPELRSLYHTLAQSPAFKIRRTLAASLGEMAKIIGEEHSRTDLMPVWRSSLGAEESEVRMKVLDAIQTFVRAIGLPDRVEVIRDLEDAFLNRKLSSWRERERAVKTLGGLVEVEGLDGEVLRRMLVNALDDRVAAVREAAVAAIPAFVRQWRDRPELLEELRADIRVFAVADTFRRRSTYVTCIQELLSVDQGDVVVRSETFWSTLSQLGRDPIVDVRIRVARVLGLISDKFSRDDSDIAAKAAALARELVQDESHEVRAFATAVVAGASPSGPTPNRSTPLATIPHRIGKSATTFSRPPPPSPNS